MNIAILGFGREGKSTLKFLKKSLPAGRQGPSFRNARISILDKKNDKNYLKNLNNFSLVFRTPGIPYNLPEIQKAIKNNVKFSSATQLFFEQLRGKLQNKRGITQKNIKIIGITGTKGKGTTSTLLYKILKACGKNVLLAGNIGKSPLDLIPKLKKNSIVILELSSFQLQDLKASPDIAVVLNIFPDHMDSHKTFSEYFNAKANIAKFQKKSDKIFYDATNKYSKLIAQKSKAKKLPIQYNDIASRKFLNCPTCDVEHLIGMPGEHNLKNVAMAAAISLSFGCPKEKIAKVIKNFKGNEHRLKFVKKIGNINFYNDSASTNPQTTIAAINAFKEPKILIAGGKDKGLSYSPLAKTLKNSNTKLVILFGENKNKIAKAILEIKNNELRIKKVKNLNSAVNIAYKTAESLIHNSNSIIHILFSPAAASFDMFKDYADRGKQFKELVKKLRR